MSPDEKTFTGECARLTEDNGKLAKDNARLTRAVEDLQLQLEEAKSANIAKEAFLSNMSHDIRTPLNAIIGMTALAKKHIDEKNRVSDALNKIEVAGVHLLSLINDVLDMSRINSGRMKIREEAFSLGDLLHETLIITIPQAEKKQHIFTFEASDIERESLYGDPLRLRQIYVNIINNAVKYTNDGGRIRVSVSEDQQDDKTILTFVCEDNGIGMDEEFLSRIFDPFERVTTSTLSGVEGTGLGMSIVKKLIDAMNGTIEVESKPGEGTKVTIKIPLRYENVALEAAALEGERILIIEADEAQREKYRRFLDEYKIVYALASTSTEAVEAVTEADFRGEPFTCAVLGRKMEEGADVFEIASYLHQSYPALTMILISDLNWQSIEYRANRSGITHFIPIPFFRKSLINGLKEALADKGGEAGTAGIPDLTGKHILLAEDNLINREIACEILSVTGAEITSCENGQEAVDAFEASPVGFFDAILMDIQMPVLDGYGAVRKIRANQRDDAQKVRIYAMTANAFAEDIAKAHESGMDGHIAKPIDINILMQTLSRLNS